MCKLFGRKTTKVLTLGMTVLHLPTNRLYGDSRTLLSYCHWVWNQFCSGEALWQMVFGTNRSLNVNSSSRACKFFCPAWLCFCQVCPQGLLKSSFQLCNGSPTVQHYLTCHSHPQRKETHYCSLSEYATPLHITYTAQCFC